MKGGLLQQYKGGLLKDDVSPLKRLGADPAEAKDSSGSIITAGEKPECTVGAPYKGSPANFPDYVSPMLAVAQSTSSCPESSPSGLCSGGMPMSRREGDGLATLASGRKKKSERSGVELQNEVSRLMGRCFPQAASLIGSLLTKYATGLRQMHGKTQSKGDIFPLPTSTDLLRGMLAGGEDLVGVLRNVCLGLNSYAGSEVESGRPATKLQMGFIKELVTVVRVSGGWEESFGKMSWEEFFRMRSVDYVGDEVAVARVTSWENLRHALPTEVGSVELEQVVGEGCKHYVQNFKEYLLDEASMTYVRPPRVMVADADWEKVCEGLIQAGVCEVMAEQELFHVAGKPLLNGLFGVEKGEMCGGTPVHRLIMNLIPLNAVCRGIQGDISTLPAWSSTGPLMLMPSQELLISSEDVRCFFYIFAVPPAWRRFLGFNKVVAEQFHPGKTGKHYLVAKVLPMGFKNSVSLAQHVHRMIVSQASKRIPSGKRLRPEQELRKDRMFPSTDVMHRVYLDNFDEMEKVDRHLAGILKGEPSQSTLALRQEYEHWNIPRHPKKAVQRSSYAEVQGAVVDGSVGCAYPKPDKILKYTQLALMTVAAGRCSQKEMQVVAGGLVYIATFRRALMGGLNSIWSFIEEFNRYPVVIRLEIPATVCLEICRFLALVPLARLDFRASPNELVTASDASTQGGGVTVSRGLSNLGQMAAVCPVRGDVAALEEMTQVLTVGLFDGIGALRVAADAAGLPVAGHVSVELNPRASRVLESRFPGTLFVDDVEKVDQEMVKQWACQYTQVGLVVLGAGPPCQGVSGLNADKKGALKDHRSRLFAHVPRIRRLLQQAFPWAQVQLLAESVQSMDSSDRAVMSEAFGCQAWAIDAQGVSLARRPRLYWVTWELEDGPGIQISQPTDTKWETHGIITLQGQVQTERYLTPGWQPGGPDRFPTFTTSRPRPYPGRRPAGVDKLSAEEYAHWQQDEYRFPPYQYQFCYQLWRGTDHRLLGADERDVIMGFPRGYTVACLPKAKQGSREHNDERLTLIGNSWNVTVVCWILCQLGKCLGLSRALTVQECIEATAPGPQRDLASFLARPLMGNSKKRLTKGNELILVKKLLNMVSIKGEDILLSSTTEETLRYHR